ncbi:MAG: hypothetical protein KatS3mg129_2994 [Leptospiraceae bacterium]|nr:MAG: hypothetical protein KatS3mg129_2994 [Leptospiraceae bacterium]
MESANKKKNYIYKTHFNMNKKNNFLYFENQKLAQYYRCPIDCPFKEEEIYCFCGQKGFCEYFHNNLTKMIQADKELIFKYR